MNFTSFLSNEEHLQEHTQEHTQDSLLLEASEKYQPLNVNELIEIVKDDNVDLANIDVSKLTSLEAAFRGSTRKNFKGIETWDVSNVVDFSGCFYEAKNFNADLSKWDVSKGKYFSSMFAYCDKFKGKGLEKWAVNKPADCVTMFFGAKSFDADLSKWELDDHTKIFHMFSACPSFKGKGLDKGGFKVLTRYKMNYIIDDVFNSTNLPIYAILDAYKTDKVDYKAVEKVFDEAVKKIPTNNAKKAVFHAKRVWGRIKAELEYQYITTKATYKFRRNVKPLCAEFVERLSSANDDDVKDIIEKYTKEIKNHMM